MEVVNLLNFLNSAKDLYTLEYAKCDYKLFNLMDLIIEDEQFTQKIDLGIIYLQRKLSDQYVIVDGLNRVLSLSLLLHAICECYKKTSDKNDKAIKTIRSKYLFDGDKTKLKLNREDQVVYEKILMGERLSGKEKESFMFQLLHKYWTQIKEDGLQAGNLFKMLQKISIVLISVENISKRDLYFLLNKERRHLNQILLIENYMKNIGLEVEWKNFKKIYNSTADLKLFFNDFFATKFNYKKYSEERLYEIFINYFDTMLQYMPEDILISKMTRTAELYSNLLNVNIADEDIKRALIKIKMSNGEDTYAYLLNIYEDYIDNNISKTTFLEILDTVKEYLQKRTKTPNNVSFNELISYLNAFITCK